MCTLIWKAFRPLCAMNGRSFRHSFLKKGPFTNYSLHFLNPNQLLLILTECLLSSRDSVKQLFLHVSKSQYFFPIGTIIFLTVGQTNFGNKIPIL